MELQSRDIFVDPISEDHQGLGFKHLQYLKQHLLKIKTKIFKSKLGGSKSSYDVKFA